MKKTFFIVTAAITVLMASKSFAGNSLSISYLADLALTVPYASDVTLDYVAHKSCRKMKANDVSVDELRGLFREREFSELLILKVKGDSGAQYRDRLKTLCKDSAWADTVREETNALQLP